MIINIAGGRGEMGITHKPVFERAGHKVIISGRETNPGFEEAAKQSDLTIVSVPISATEETIRKVAPYCRAIMDFTTFKKFPIEAMLKYSSGDCEVAGLHPNYGAVSSIDGRTIFQCKTERTGERCREVVSALKLAGAKIIEIDPGLHDRIVVGHLINGRARYLEEFAFSLMSDGINFKTAYALASPPAKIMLDLLGRQIAGSRDQLYGDIEKFAESQDEDEQIIKNIMTSLSSKERRGILRQWIGDDLNKLQEEAARAI